MSESTSSEQPDQVPMASPMNDIRKLKQNSQATASEIHEFLAKMRGKSPVEVLGAVANSNLGKSFLQAGIGVAVLVLVLTVIPWAMSLAGGEGKDEVAETNPAVSEVEKAAPEATAKDEAKPEESAAPIEIDPVDPNRAAADKMGVTEEKTAPLNVNPLEGSNDDLLKGLE